MDLKRLREETRLEHEATEAAMPLMTPALTLRGYAEVLRTLLPMVRSWEEWAAQHAPPNVQAMLGKRRRSPWLEADLRALGTLGERVPSCPEEDVDERIDWDAVVGVAPPGRNTAVAPAELEAAFLGALYVMEGSTLGGRMIARHLERFFDFQDGCGLAYFRGHGDQTGRLWREITSVLEAVPEAHADILIEAARRTFRAFGAALGRLGEHRASMFARL